MKKLIALALALTIASCGTTGDTSNHSVSTTERPTIDRSPSMYLGHFSISLSVKDLATSREFYEKLGFVVTHGVVEHNYLILQNGDHTIGLFQGMFEGNIMTFNPGWNARAERLDEFKDVREIQRHLKEQGIALTTEADESTTGPASLTLIDPDGNVILMDQHVE